MNNYRVLIRTWTGKETWIACRTWTENDARQYVHGVYGRTTEIIEVQCVCAATAQLVRKET